MSQEQEQAFGFSTPPSDQSSEMENGGQPQNKAKDILEKLEAKGQVKVIHGASDDAFPIAGANVKSVRANLVDAFNIPGDALAFVNGEQVSEEYILQANCTLEFVKQAGVKGKSLWGKDLR